MKLRTVLLAVSSILLVWSFAFPFSFAAASGQSVVRVKQEDNGKTIHAKIGQSVEIVLSGNPTTGYSWTVSDIEGKALKQAGKVVYKAGEPQKPGSGGTFSAHLDAVTSGNSNVKMIYVRPWEKSAQPARMFSVSVEVESAK
jgi:inhibitor of cysteine peptidase